MTKELEPLADLDPIPSLGITKAFGFCPLRCILKNTTFRKLDLFPSSDVGGWGKPIPLGSLERAS
jgi:hypothetical protein